MGSQISAAGAINSVLEQADVRSASPHVLTAIQSASLKTGVNFSYLVQKASQESSFDPTAKATSSTATGLFQFTSQTWLHMIKDYGSQYGLGQYAAKIEKGADGRLSVSDTATRQAILALRKDPQISAEMAGELDKENAAVLEKKVGGKIGATELYLAHFLGANGASRFIKEMRSNPKTAAADVMPTAAGANRSVFYSKSGEARSLQQIYQKFAQKFEKSDTQVASLTSRVRAASGASAMNAPVNSELSINVAKLLPTDTGASDNSVLKKGTDMASLNSSSLFDAMVYGQIQNTGLGATSPSAALDLYGNNKKKNGPSLFSSEVVA